MRDLLLLKRRNSALKNATGAVIPSVFAIGLVIALQLVLRLLNPIVHAPRFRLKKGGFALVGCGGMVSAGEGHVPWKQIFTG
jgi:hypothetical protein